ncbi:hypothetical protein [Mycetocola sp. JXN-3]|uniref:hypothetical protein n=1 Tax=Mycetocola sp. JXN-3 TaxID=2116510 RepID=UPI00165D2BD3|nr:hypothetical protein [Mycetocola sp. JXN-3]
MSPAPRRARDVEHPREPLIPKKERGGVYVGFAVFAVVYVGFLALILVLGMHR